MWNIVCMQTFVLYGFGCWDRTDNEQILLARLYNVNRSKIGIGNYQLWALRKSNYMINGHVELFLIN